MNYFNTRFHHFDPDGLPLIWETISFFCFTWKFRMDTDFGQDCKGWNGLNKNICMPWHQNWYWTWKHIFTLIETKGDPKKIDIRHFRFDRLTILKKTVIIEVYEMLKLRSKAFAKAMWWDLLGTIYWQWDQDWFVWRNIVLIFELSPLVLGVCVQWTVLHY